MKRMLIGFLVGTALNLAAVFPALAVPYTTATTLEFLKNGSAIANSGIDTTTGLGTASYVYSTPGSYDVRAFLDLEIDLSTTGFFNEFGATSGSAASGQSWEIGIPNYPYTLGDGSIYDHFLNGSLTSAIGNGLDQTSDDVAMAMGWIFTLGANQQATVSFTSSESVPGSGFYLIQTDDLTGNQVFLSGNLGIRDIGGGNNLPEPSTVALLGLALAGMLTYRGRKAK